EKETGVPEERRQVASVFVNRLRQGMRLQTDPTVIYGITKGQGTLGRGLRQSELRGVTPWNTYVIEGLPPTPIANPGMASLEAAVDPANTDYVFFVADGTGGHAFAETLQEHNRNVARWREIEAEQQNSGN
ncbi:endolytic transglycosylase MltG, partial [Cribrihabitans sp. XS_ASV171]